MLKISGELRIGGPNQMLIYWTKYSYILKMFWWCDNVYYSILQQKKMYYRQTDGQLPPSRALGPRKRRLFSRESVFLLLANISMCLFYLNLFYFILVHWLNKWQLMGQSVSYFSTLLVRLYNFLPMWVSDILHHINIWSLLLVQEIWGLVSAKT